MGISFHEYKFLEHISNLNKFGSVLTLGKQEIILDSFDKTRLNLTNNSYINDQYIDQLLINNFNAKSVKSIDNSKFEGADIIMDMNKPIENINEKFDTIIDFGTSGVLDPQKKMSQKFGTPYYIAPEVLKKSYN